MTTAAKQRRKASRAQHTYSGESDLGDSWVVNDGSDSDESHFDDSSEEELKPPRSQRSARRKAPSRVHTGTAESEIFPGRAISNAEFQMPVLDHHEQPTPVRQRKSVTRKSERPRRPIRRQSHTQEAAAGVAETAGQYVKEILLYVLDIVGMVFNGLKVPVAYLIMGWLAVGILTILMNLATRRVSTALEPICRIPGVSLLDLSFCVDNTAIQYGAEPPPPEFDRLMESQSRFEDILASSAVGVSLPADMKRTEAAVRDLRTLVRYSQLKSRSELSLEFDGFVETARMASSDLQKFNSRTGRAADVIISTARWTMQTLDDVNEHRAARGAISAFVSDTLLAPFTPTSLTPVLVLNQYVEHTRKVEEEINTLLQQAQSLLLTLNNLEERLDVIHAISTRDEQIAHLAKEELLGQLWTYFGKNRKDLKKYKSQLELLHLVGKYRETAWAHVSMTVLKLQAMHSELEELRERVGSSELLRDRKDVPLRVHLEVIQKGVERLEAGRLNMRTAEMDWYSSVMGRGREQEIDGPVKGKLIDMKRR